MHKRFFTALLALTLLPALSGAANAQSLTADQIIEKHLAAIGGREALTKLTSLKATGTFSVDTPMGALGGPLEMLAKAPNKVRTTVRIDVSAVGGPGEMVQEQIFDGTNGWTLNSLQGDQAMSGDELESAKNDFFPTALLKYKDMGVKVELKPAEDVSGKKAHVLTFTPKSGPAETMYFDQETFMLVRSRSTVNSAQMGSIEQISDPSDYRTVDGVKVAFQLAQAGGGQSIMIKLTKVEHNVAIDDAVFIKK